MKNNQPIPTNLIKTKIGNCDYPDEIKTTQGLLKRLFRDWLILHHDNQNNNAAFLMLKSSLEQSKFYHKKSNFYKKLPSARNLQSTRNLHFTWYIVISHNLYMGYMIHQHTNTVRVTLAIIIVICDVSPNYTVFTAVFKTQAMVSENRSSNQYSNQLPAK